MILQRLAFVFLLATHGCGAAAASLAFTFDDGVNPDVVADGAAWNARILEHLRTAGAQAMIFPSIKASGTGGGKALLRAWSDAGHLVGNHSSKHRNFGASNVTAESFIEDVKELEAAYGDLPTFTKRLRLPYLKEGDTREKRDALRAWMKGHGYAPGAPSIDTSDWYYDRVYLEHRAAGDARRASAVRAAYVRHLVDRANYYDSLAKVSLGRGPAHVLLLHVNAINADALGEAVEAFRRAGWTIVGAAKAFEDPLYATEPDVVPAGESIVWANAKAKGVDGLRYPGEDARYEEPLLEALGLRP